MSKPSPKQLTLHILSQSFQAGNRMLATRASRLEESEKGSWPYAFQSVMLAQQIRIETLERIVDALLTHANLPVDTNHQLPIFGEEEIDVGEEDVDEMFADMDGDDIKSLALSADSPYMETRRPLDGQKVTVRLQVTDVFAFHTALFNHKVCARTMDRAAFNIGTTKVLVLEFLNLLTKTNVGVFDKGVALSMNLDGRLSDEDIDKLMDIFHGKIWCSDEHSKQQVMSAIMNILLAFTELVVV